MASFDDAAKHDANSLHQRSQVAGSAPLTLPFRRHERLSSRRANPEHQTDERLQLVNDFWPRLPEAIKQAIFDTVFEQA